MGVYRRYVAPLLVNATCASSLLDRARTRACEGLEGTVLEVGFGAGRNLDFYPSTVTRVLAVEPSEVAMRVARRHIERSSIPVQHVSTHGESIDLPDASCDHALATFTLCSVTDPHATLREIARVLRPGGRLHFAEHGLAPDPGVARWQRRLDPLEMRLADGCHLTRDPVALLVAAQFELDWIEQKYAGGPKPWAYFSIGVAHPTT